VAFLGGIAGKLYQQFAVTVALSVVLSGVVALTLTPALCGVLLKPTHTEPKAFRWFNRAFGALTEGYAKLVDKTLHHRILGASVFATVIVASVVLFRLVPGGFVPAEDQGYLISALVLPDNIRNRYRLQLESWLFHNRENPCLHEHEVNHVQRLIDYLDVVKTPHSEAFEIPKLLNDFKQFYTQYDQRRNKDFVKTFPQLAEWYDSIQI
jgi:multidrug efflux pump subunit AcrB